MVGADDDDGLVGMLLVELIGHLHSLVHIQYFVDDIADIVAVAGPVNQATLNGKEETVVLL